MADGEKTEINRYFKEDGDDWKEIDFDEYKARESIANQLEIGIAIANKMIGIDLANGKDFTNAEN